MKMRLTRRLKDVNTVKKRHTFICILACLLLLPCGAQGARVMDMEETVAAPIGEETPAVAVHESAGGAFADAVDVVSTETISEGEFAQLNDADSLHTAAGDHTGWNGIAATATLSTDNYYLSDDFTGNLTVAAGETAVLCLNGHTITSATGTTILVSKGATLRICDCQGGGCITGGAGRTGGGLNVNGGTLELYGGRITGNKATQTGAGGGVCVAVNGTFSMYGGSVDHNEAKSGGGVYVSSGSKFVMTGGSITNNTATTHGGGAYVMKSDETSLDGESLCRFSGSPVIVDNMVGGAADNVYLCGGEYINIPAALTNEARVGISVEKLGQFARPRNSSLSADCAARFTSDSETYGIGVNADGRLLLDVPVTVTYTVPAGVSGTAPAAQHCIAGETVTVDTETVLTKDGYGFVGWTNNRDVKKARAEVVPTEDTLLYPVFYVGFKDTGKSTQINMTYGVDIESIDLSDFVRLTDGSGATFRFGVEESLPLGLKLVNDAGEEKGVRHIITGRPVATPGDYTVKFTVNQVGEAAILFDLAQSPSFQSGELTIAVHIAKPSISAADFEFAPPTQLTQNGEVKAATVTPRRGVAGGVGAITLRYSPAEPVMAGTYQVFADVAEGSRYQGATNLTDPGWTFTIAEPVTPSSGVVLGAPQWVNGRTLIALTPTPANLLNGAQVLAARYEDGAMVDLAWGTLSGNTVAFSGKQLTVNSGWKLFFLDSNSYAPLCAAVPLTSSTP